MVRLAQLPRLRSSVLAVGLRLSKSRFGRPLTTTHSPPLPMAHLVKAAVGVSERVAAGTQKPQVVAPIIGAVPVDMIPSERDAAIDSPAFGPATLKALLTKVGEPPALDVLGHAPLARVGRIEFSR